MTPCTIFMSDMHLCADTPELNALFIRKLDEWAGKIDALYLLGDLFEVWIGDDDDEPVFLYHFSSFFCYRAWLLGLLGFSSFGRWAQHSWLPGSRTRLSPWGALTGLVSPKHVESFQTRD